MKNRSSKTLHYFRTISIKLTANLISGLKYLLTYQYHPYAEDYPFTGDCKYKLSGYNRLCISKSETPWIERVKTSAFKAN
jgi:hypothetical protein